MSSLTQQDLEHIYEMVDTIPFSRPKRNIHRDFSDGCMMAELLHYYFPKYVELHNYPATNSLAAKIGNWQTLNEKVLKKLGISLKRKDIEGVVKGVPYQIEKILKVIFNRVENTSSEQPIGNPNRHERTEQNQNNGNDQSRHVHFADQQNQSAEVSDLLEKIDQSYLQLIQLQDILKLKQGVIRNLQRKVDALL